MDNLPDQLAGGILSPIFSFKKQENLHNNYHIQQHILINQNKTYHHNTNIYTNSSQNKILSLSGSNNQAIMFNDAQFHTKNIFERPIFFYFNQHSTILSLIIILILFLLVILTIIGSYIYYRQNRQQTTPPFRQYTLLNNKRSKNIHDKNNHHLLDKSIGLSADKRIQKDSQQNEKNLLKENDNNKIDAKVTKCSNIRSHTNIIALPEQDKMSTIRTSTDCYPNSTSINIYDIPPVHSISQWARDELLKYMKM